MDREFFGGSTEDMITPVTVTIGSLVFKHDILNIWGYELTKAKLDELVAAVRESGEYCESFVLSRWSPGSPEYEEDVQPIRRLREAVEAIKGGANG